MQVDTFILDRFNRMNPDELVAELNVLYDK